MKFNRKLQTLTLFNGLSFFLMHLWYEINFMFFSYLQPIKPSIWKNTKTINSINYRQIKCHRVWADFIYFFLSIASSKHHRKKIRDCIMILTHTRETRFKYFGIEKGLLWHTKIFFPLPLADLVVHLMI